MIDDWYDDPTGRYLRRYWEQMAWTNEVQRWDGTATRDDLTDPQLALLRRPPDPSVVPPDLPPASPYAGPGPSQPWPTYYAPYPRYPENHGLALASLVIGVVGIGFMPFVSGILAIVLGAVARRQIADAPDRYTGGGMATAGIVLGVLQVAFFVILVLVLIAAAANNQ